MQGNTLLKDRTQMMNNKIKLHILGVPVNKLGICKDNSKDKGIGKMYTLQ